MSKPVIFLGSSFQLFSFVDICNEQNIPMHGIIDSDYYGNTESFEDLLPYIDSEQTANWGKLKKEFDFFIGVSNTPTVPRNVIKRLNFIDLIEQYDLPCINLIDRQTLIPSTVTLGKGIYIGFHSAIGPKVTIKDHVTLHPINGIGHHSTVGKNAVIQRDVVLTSNTTVGDNAYIGISAKCLKEPNMRIGKDSIIHPGVIVMRDVEDGETIKLTGRKVYTSVVGDIQNT